MKIFSIALCLLAFATNGFANGTKQSGTELNVNGLHLGSFVYASPYIGEASEYDSLDLVVNFPYINEDLLILQQRQKLDDLLAAKSPLIELSGKVTGKFTAIEDTPNTFYKTDLDLDSAELDVLANVSPWASAFMSFAYDNTVPVGSVASRVSNSRIQIKTGFVTIGKLESYPVYGSIGQMFVPFGDYTNFMLSDPLTKLLARTKARTVLLGFYHSGFYGSIYGLKGDTYTSGKVDSKNGRNAFVSNGGVNFGYKFDHGQYFNGDIGAGYILNLADSEGIQPVISSIISGNKLQNKIPAYNIHGRLTYGYFLALGEYTATTRKFAMTELPFGTDAAKVSALDLEGAVQFPLLNKPAMFSIGYGRTWEAANLGLPKDSYMTRFAMSIWKNTVASVEYRHNDNYAASKYLPSPPYPSLVAPKNAIILGIGAYF